MGTLRPHYQQKYFFRPIGAFVLLKLKVTKIPIILMSTKWALFSTLSSTFLLIGGDRNKINYISERPGP